MTTRRALLALLLAGCGGPSTDGDAGGGTDAATRPTGTLDFAPCDDGLECATLEVPLDHGDPSGRRLALAVTRRPAARPERRIGVLVINFGGPGNPSGYALRLPQIQLLFAIERDLRDRFDVVVLDGRGIGESEPALACPGIDFLDRSGHLFDLVPTADAAEQATVEAGIAALIEECTGRVDLELAARMDTTSSARDMELLRIALGEEQLNYLGISYGTLLGSVYATLYPEHVRAFVLDGPLPPVPDMPTRSRAFVAAREASFARFLDWCASDTSCAFREGPDAASIGAAFGALIDRRRAEPLVTDDGRRFDGHRIWDEAMELLYTKAWPAIGILLAAARDGETAGLPGGVSSSLPDAVRENVGIAMNAIRCLDTPVPEDFTDADFAAYLAELEAAHPYTGRMSGYDLLICRHWPLRIVEGPVVHAPAAPPMLVVAVRHDPALAHTLAGDLITRLDNGSHLLTYEGDGHGALALSVDCALPAEVAYLVDPTSTPPTSCP